ncbi:MAG: YtoQ family protein [bacterium]|nr:YtoQ family protein [bacterium]
MELEVYLAGEIHSSWREDIINGCIDKGLPVRFHTPVVTHDASDNVGVDILGPEDKAIWKDYKAAKINSVRIRKGIEDSDIVVVKFGEKYRQWNAAFDAGYAAAIDKPYIVIHPEEFSHALKEIDSQAVAVARTESQVVDILAYLANQR